MTTTPSPPSLVLRGRNATARFAGDGDHVEWEQDGRTLRIPLEGIEDVRGLDRAIEIVLTSARAGRPAAVYALHDAGAPAVAAFSAAVQARLRERAPDRPRADGEDLVVTVSVQPGRQLTRRASAIAAAIAVCVAIDVTVWLLGGSQPVVALPLAQLFAAAGVFILTFLGRGLYDGRRLPKHGITVLAELDHYTHNTKVYRYTDLDGEVHYYREATGGQQLELSYDPRRPSRAVARLSPYMQVMMALMTLVGLAMACAGVGFTFHELAVALRG
ncbi:conserved hypothetical protein [Streptomyces viridochromogenes DSM 40736]|uniref:Uncharacterized protein n=1 Tax=Streptomyces viridochromogenes (strain DSM 40736 / JCM 4977 / BCRC 1201 / Tue 494) TaxID=591159 RepID=D9X3N3_STRVT|nr:DUF3592 domain-containing protein [Streptomyces viridochromogenes]EFL31666.1 conserved hypothetical protein [Streptomyces viridochromogenes DSM 40736]